MKTFARSLTTLALSFTVSLSGQDVPAEDKLVVEPITQIHDLNGVPITLPLSLSVTVDDRTEDARLNIRFSADLSDLQAKIGPIIDTFPFPNNNCDIVTRFWGKQLHAGKVAMLELHGDIEKWSCVCVFGCHRVGPITQPFDARLPFSLVLINSREIGIMFGQPTITLGGSLGSVTSGILQIAGVDLNARVREALLRVVDFERLKVSLPPAVVPFDPQIEKLSFVDNGGRLEAEIQMTALVPSSALSKFASLANEQN